MEIGASTSCFYPLETEKALDKVISLDFKTAEVFFNSPCELEEPFVKQEVEAPISILSTHYFFKACKLNACAKDLCCQIKFVKRRE